MGRVHFKGAVFVCVYSFVLPGVQFAMCLPGTLLKCICCQLSCPNVVFYVTRSLYILFFLSLRHPPPSISLSPTPPPPLPSLSLSFRLYCVSPPKCLAPYSAIHCASVSFALVALQANAFWIRYQNSAIVHAMYSNSFNIWLSWNIMEIVQSHTF